MKINDPLVATIVEGLQDCKAQDIRVVDMSKMEEAAVMYFVTCEGTSSTHVAGIAGGLTDYVRSRSGQHSLGTIGLANRQWVAIDYGHVLVHIFQPETRQFYRLEELWSDAPQVEIEN